MRYDLLIKSISRHSAIKYIDLQKRLENHNNNFTHYPPFWRLYNKKVASYTFKWEKLEFSSNEDPNVYDGTPGVYMFVLKPAPTVFDDYKFVMYVGMTEEGLKERLNSGYRKPSSVKRRPNVHRLILDYGNYLTWYYMPFPGKGEEELKEIESMLIGFFNDPPINRKDAPIEIKQAKKSKMS